MFQILEARTANRLWKDASSWFGESGVASQQTSRSGVTQEVMNVGFCLEDPRQRWICSRVPAMNPAFAIAEIVWIIRGRNDAAMLNYFNPKLPEFAGKDSTYHGAYGKRMRSHFGIDQLEKCYNVLSANSDSRQVVLQIWDSKVDFPRENGVAVAPDVPCNISSLLKIRGDRLQWTQVMRSNDLFRGFPHNVIQFSTLQEVIAGWLGIEVGSYHHYSDSLHLYKGDGDVDEHFEDVDSPDNCDRLGLPKDQSDIAFEVLSGLCDHCASPVVSAKDIVNIVSDLQVPEAYLNLARVLAADALRRRKASEEMEAVIQKCTNSCLIFMFDRWNRKLRIN